LHLCPEEIELSEWEAIEKNQRFSIKEG